MFYFYLNFADVNQNVDKLKDAETILRIHVREM